MFSKSGKTLNFAHILLPPILLLLHHLMLQLGLTWTRVITRILIAVIGACSNRFELLVSLHLLLLEGLVELLKVVINARVIVDGCMIQLLWPSVRWHILIALLSPHRVILGLKLHLVVLHQTYSAIIVVSLSQHFLRFMWWYLVRVLVFFLHSRQFLLLTMHVTHVVSVIVRDCPVLSSFLRYIWRFVATVYGHRCTSCRLKSYRIVSHIQWRWGLCILLVPLNWNTLGILCPLLQVLFLSLDINDLSLIIEICLRESDALHFRAILVVRSCCILHLHLLLLNHIWILGVFFK